MKINDIIFRFKKPSGSDRDGICRLRTFANSEGQLFVLLTELDNNTSTSITNVIEAIHSQLSDQGFLLPGTTLIEHNEHYRYGSFNEVRLHDNNRSNTEWIKLSKNFVISRLECSTDEFDENSKDRIRILNEAEALSSAIDRSRNRVFQQSSEYINRYLEIESKQISKKSIEKLVEERAGERALQKLLKQDLSIFAELYAEPSDQYICFSEFPLEDGSVDFVVFSGISRMDVFLIEIKGADFNLVNKGNYEKYSSQMEIAISQIRHRIGSVSRNYEKFREEVHSIRRAVESGAHKYNSLLGPYGSLQVDQGKDINIHPVVIGGATVNDIAESEIRHDTEFTFTPRVRVETWNSWLRKLQRE